MKTLHYPQTFLTPSETYIARYMQRSVGWGATAVMSPKQNDDYKRFEGLEQVKRYRIGPVHYKKEPLKDFIRLCYGKLTGARWLKIPEVVRDFEPDVIHCHFGIQGILYNMAFTEHKPEIPFVVSFYGYDASQIPESDPEYRELLPSMFDHASALFAEGEEMKKKIVHLGAPANKVLINPILIPVDDYQQKDRWYQPGEKIVFICAGRFLEKKGFHLFLDAIGELKNSLPPFHIQMVGDGKMRKVYDGIIKHHDLEHHVSYLGWLHHQKLLEQMRLADFFVHPSVTAKNGDSEGGAPTILLEAQAMKLPVVTSTHADIPNIMGYDNFIADEKDIIDLKKKILSAVTGNDLRELVNRGYRKVKKDHDLNSGIYRRNMEQVLRDR